MMNNCFFRCACLTVVMMLAGWPCLGADDFPRLVDSADGVPISYQVQGSGEIALVFIHGWSCDSRYWKNQVGPLSAKYKVITLDLAGHGHSGMARKDYTVPAFGADVKAVVEAEKADKVILIGHSMGGSVMAEASLLLPGKVLALVAVDTLQNVAEAMKEEALQQMLAPLEKEFRSGAKAFVGCMFPPEADPAAKEWIINDISAAPEFVAMSAMRNYVETYRSGTVTKLFDQVTVPVYAINAPLWPTNVEANRQHLKVFELTTIEGCGHFPMLEKPDVFNGLLAQVVDKIVTAGKE